jgi:hypothetical protein
MNQRDALCLVGASVTGLIVPDVLGWRTSAGAGNSGVTLEPFDPLLNGFPVPEADPRGGRPLVPA